MTWGDLIAKKIAEQRLKESSAPDAGGPVADPWPEPANATVDLGSIVGAASVGMPQVVVRLPLNRDGGPETVSAAVSIAGNAANAAVGELQTRTPADDADDVAERDAIQSFGTAALKPAIVVGPSALPAMGGLVSGAWTGCANPECIGRFEINSKRHSVWVCQDGRCRRSRVDRPAS
jgi:hypothetical protein